METWNFWVLAGTDYLMFTVAAFPILANECLVMCLTFHISTQLKILGFRLRECCKNYEDYSLSAIAVDEKLQNVEYDSKPNQELIHCIQHYQQIVR